MDEKNNGTIIEGFVRGAYGRMFDNPIQVQHHPLTSWAQATVSGSQSNFEDTKDNVIRTLKGVTHTLYHAGGNDELLNELSEFESARPVLFSIVRLLDLIPMNQKRWSDNFFYGEGINPASAPVS